MALSMLLCSYGASRVAVDNVDGWTAIACARKNGHDILADLLEATSHWTTPLHYLEVLDSTLTPHRASALLSARADPHARDPTAVAAPSPFELAKAMRA